MIKRKRRKMRGTVQQVLKPLVPHELEKAQISVDEAEELYREIRIENVLTDENAEKVRLKPGADVDVVVEADTDATIKMPSA
jgi:predicted DNA-binding antitoxin AbrB/MazE fold protein